MPRYSSQAPAGSQGPMGTLIAAFVGLLVVVCVVILGPVSRISLFILVLDLFLRNGRVYPGSRTKPERNIRLERIVQHSTSDRSSYVVHIGSNWWNRRTEKQRSDCAVFGKLGLISRNRFLYSPGHFLVRVQRHSARWSLYSRNCVKLFNLKSVWETKRAMALMYLISLGRVVEKNPPIESSFRHPFLVTVNNQVFTI